MRAASNRLTLLVGGARSGKSDLAVQIGARHPDQDAVTFVATAQRFDDDMSTRIDRHRAERPPWPTVEAPVDLAGAVTAVQAEHLLIIDCLTLWVSNLMLEQWSEEAVRDASAATAAAAAARSGPTVVVSNEVGLGIHPGNELGRQYRDLLGQVNRQWAGAAGRSMFLVAGRALPLTDPWELLS
jgi:adenosylcobinamide kinase/adenosylcobinamide-phosphate guanylyltransferase